MALLLKESNGNQCCRDKGGVVLSESTVMVLSLGKLVHLTSYTSENQLFSQS